MCSGSMYGFACANMLAAGSRGNVDQKAAIAAFWGQLVSAVRLGQLANLFNRESTVETSCVEARCKGDGARKCEPPGSARTDRVGPDSTLSRQGLLHANSSATEGRGNEEEEAGLDHHTAGVARDGARGEGAAQRCGRAGRTDPSLTVGG